MSAGKVVTVLGEIEPSEMGNTLTHDHLMVDGWGLRNLYEAILDDERIAIDEVRLFKAAGGGTICDPTNIGLKRDPAALARMANRDYPNVKITSLNLKGNYKFDKNWSMTAGDAMRYVCSGKSAWSLPVSMSMIRRCSSQPAMKVYFPAIAGAQWT